MIEAIGKQRFEIKIRALGKLDSSQSGPKNPMKTESFASGVSSLVFLKRKQRCSF